MATCDFIPFLYPSSCICSVEKDEKGYKIQTSKKKITRQIRSKMRERLGISIIDVHVKCCKSFLCFWHHSHLVHTLFCILVLFVWLCTFRFGILFPPVAGFMQHQEIRLYFCSFCRYCSCCCLPLYPNGEGNINVRKTASIFFHLSSPRYQHLMMFSLSLSLSLSLYSSVRTKAI